MKIQEIKKEIIKNKNVKIVVRKCPFLLRNNLCSIHNHKPRCCRNYATKTKNCVPVNIRKKCSVFIEGDCNRCGLCCRKARWLKNVPLTKGNVLCIFNIKCKECPLYKT